MVAIRALAALLLAVPLQGLAQTAEPVRTIEIAASRIVNFRLGSAQTDFGALEFVGGLQLSAGDKDFGGLSGLRLLDDRSAFVAVSDEGFWFAGRLLRDGGGALAGVEAVSAGPLGPPRGKLPAPKREIDCEGIAVAGPFAYLSYERNHRIERVALVAGRPSGRPQPIVARGRISGLANNQGLEALAAFPPGSARAGSLIAIAEESLDAAGNSRAFIVSGGGISEFSVLRSDDFSPTDADFLPGGDLLLLERHFSLKRGPLMRIRRIAAADLAPGRIATGETLLVADATYRIDNMEGIAVSEGADGSVHVALVSDDNFSPLQSTLLLEFRLRP
jgi:hypothetical protein